MNDRTWQDIEFSGKRKKKQIRKYKRKLFFCFYFNQLISLCARENNQGFGDILLFIPSKSFIIFNSISCIFFYFFVSLKKKNLYKTRGVDFVCIFGWNSNYFNISLKEKKIDKKDINIKDLLTGLIAFICLFKCIHLFSVSLYNFFLYTVHVNSLYCNKIIFILFSFWC